MFLSKGDQKDGDVPKSPFNKWQPLPSVGKQSKNQPYLSCRGLRDRLNRGHETDAEGE
jgi:hypothetical protein